MSARDQLLYLDAAIARTEARIDAMDREWYAEGALCCPGCMFGATYYAAEKKLERQQAWRAILVTRARPEAP